MFYHFLLSLLHFFLKYVNINLSFKGWCFTREDDKDIEIVSGDGKDLDISPVYDHIDIEKPKEEKEKKNIIIPDNKK